MRALSARLFSVRQLDVSIQKEEIPNTKHKKSNLTCIFIAIIVILAVFGGIGFGLYEVFNADEDSATGAPTEAPTALAQAQLLL